MRKCSNDLAQRNQQILVSEILLVQDCSGWFKIFWDDLICLEILGEQIQQTHPIFPCDHGPVPPFVQGVFPPSLMVESSFCKSVTHLVFWLAVTFLIRIGERTKPSNVSSVPRCGWDQRPSDPLFKSPQSAVPPHQSGGWVDSTEFNELKMSLLMHLKDTN